MDPFNLLNIRPNYRHTNLPCDGKVGDLVVLSPLAEGEYDSLPASHVSVWICIKGSETSEGRQKALWGRIAFNGLGQCEYPVADPPQDIPSATRG